MILERLPDDIEQYLIDGLSIQAIEALMTRCGFDQQSARERIWQWLIEARARRSPSARLTTFSPGVRMGYIDR